MAARKNRLILYEVVHRDRRPREAGGSHSSAAPPVKLAGTPTPTPPRPADPGSSSSETTRSLRVVNKILHVRLGWPAMVVVAVGVIIVLGVAFQAGSRYVRSHDSDPEAITARARHDPVVDNAAATEAPSVLDRGPAEQTAVVTPERIESTPEPRPVLREEKPPPPPPFEFKKGHHYIVIQHFYPKHHKTARAAARFMRKEGLACIVVTRRADIELVATTSFMFRQQDAEARAAERRHCDVLKTRIREIGKRFSKAQRAAGKPEYAFEQCYERLHTR